MTFAGFPGRYVPGEPVEVNAVAAAAGVDTESLLALVDELELPLDVVDVKPGSGPLPVADNHIGSGEIFGLGEPDGDGDQDADDEPATAETDGDGEAVI